MAGSLTVAFNKYPNNHTQRREFASSFKFENVAARSVSALDFLRILMFGF
jgi:hypothetical protein